MRQKIAAALLTVSPDTVCDLFARANCRVERSGGNGLPPKRRCCGGLKAARQRDTLARAIERGDRDALAEASNSGEVRARQRNY